MWCLHLRWPKIRCRKLKYFHYCTKVSLEILPAGFVTSNLRTTATCGLFL
jgi:hypothetical protein